MSESRTPGGTAFQGPVARPLARVKMKPQVLHPRPADRRRRLCAHLLAFLLPAVLGLRPAAAGTPPGQSRAAPTAHAAGAQFTAARSLLRQGKTDAALAAAEAGLKAAPRSVKGLNLLGVIYVHKGDYTRAVASFERALSVNPHSAETYTNLGNAYFAERKLDLAEREFRAALQENPGDRQANYNLGSVLLAKKEPRLAITYFNRVQPPDPEVLLNLSQAYFAAGDKAKGLEVAKSLSERAKGNVRAHFTLGVMLAAEQQYAAAIHEFEAADALQPGTLEILQNLGQAYLKSGDNAKALEVLGRALKVRPDSAETLYLMAQAYSDDGKDLNALDVLVKAHKLAPDNTDVVFLMARLSMKQSFYADAIPLLEQGLKAAPGQAKLLAALGECYFMVGKTTQAKDTFQTLIHVDPSAASYAFMGLWYRHQGQFDQAVKYFQLGLKADPKSAACLYNLGFIASREGNYDAGQKWLTEALAIQPDYDDALLELANLKMHQKKYAEALPLLRKCARLDPNPAPVYYRLAETERSLHQMDAAERDLKVFQTLSKDPKPLPYPYQHLFDYVGQRAALPAEQKDQLDLAQLEHEVKVRSEDPHNYYMLAEAYLKLGKTDDARRALAEVDKLSQGDFRSSVGVGVLLARYGLYPEAVAHFQQALQTNPGSDDAWYDLADAYFRMRRYADALAAVERLSASGRNDSSCVALLADIDAHLGRAEEAVRLYRREIGENPDRDQTYLSLALVYLHAGDVSAAHTALEEGLGRIPDSGELVWGMGIVAAAEGNATDAERDLKRSIDLLPQWPDGYSALGVLYYETGQIDKARQTLEQFSQNGPRGALDAQRIEQVLSAAAQKPSNNAAESFPPQARQQFLQFALTMADRSR